MGDTSIISYASFSYVATCFSNTKVPSPELRKTSFAVYMKPWFFFLWQSFFFFYKIRFIGRLFSIFAIVTWGRGWLLFHPATTPMKVVALYFWISALQLKQPRFILIVCTASFTLLFAWPSSKGWFSSCPLQKSILREIYSSEWGKLSCPLKLIFSIGLRQKASICCFFGTDFSGPILVHFKAWSAVSCQSDEAAVMYSLEAKLLFSSAFWKLWSFTLSISSAVISTLKRAC